jgi:TorA maturation chaperone TorD
VTPTGHDVEVAATYRLLSLAFSPPREETLAELEALVGGLAERPDAPAALQALAELLDALSPAELEADFARLFTRDPICPPYEGSYEADPFRQARELADVNGFYLAFGARPAGPAAERADHVACELEFLSYLVLARLAAAEAGRSALESTCRDAEDAFLLDHLGRFGGAFFSGVRDGAHAPFYTQAAEVGERFLAGELAGRGLAPEPSRGRRRLAVEADCLRCGAA